MSENQEERPEEVIINSLELELRKAVAYGIGIMCGKHGLSMVNHEILTESEEYAKSAMSRFVSSHEGEDDHDKILRLVGEDAAAKYDLGVAYSKVIDGQAKEIQGE
jgi:hypothetical protein